MKNQVKADLPDVRPPNPPWKSIEYKATNLATISFYYGDAKSAVIPIRDVSNRRDAKPDPNIETGTYGLFSVCCKKERKAIVEKGIPLQFFCTSRKGSVRVLTGYYRPAWYCELEHDDYAIAADRVRFVSPGFELEKLTTFMDGFPIDTFFRGRSPWRYILEPEVIRKFLLLLYTAADSTVDYLKEINKQEKDALEQYGYIYNNRTEGLSWTYAAELMRKRGLLG
jgi:hypothetical protein